MKLPLTDSDEGSLRGSVEFLAVVDIATFVADLKDHAADHGFHVHDDRHFVETYSMRQAWEVDLHPAVACGGPLDVHITLEVDPRVMLSFEDHLIELPEGVDPSDDFKLPLVVSWSLPPLPDGPDLLLLATELAGIGGMELPLDVSAIDAYAAVTDAPERSISITARVEVSISGLFTGHECLGGVMPKVAEISEFLLDRAPAWLGDI